jgi:hypothetical protein
MLAGFALLIAAALLEALLSRYGGRTGAGAHPGDADISEQVWQVLAEARRIVEESA